MDLNKIGALANIGNFGVGVIALYLMSHPQQPAAMGVPGATMISIQPTMWIFWSILGIAALFNFAAALIQTKGSRHPITKESLQMSVIPSNTSQLSSSLAYPPINMSIDVDVDITPEDLTALYQNHLSDEANKLFGDWVGKRMSASGKLSNRREYEKEIILTCLYKSQRDEWIGFSFTFDIADKNTVMHLKRDDVIIVTGEIESATHDSLALKHCHLVKRQH